MTCRDAACCLFGEHEDGVGWTCLVVQALEQMKFHGLAVVELDRVPDKSGTPNTKVHFGVGVVRLLIDEALALLQKNHQTQKESVTL